MSPHHAQCACPACRPSADRWVGLIQLLLSVLSVGIALGACGWVYTVLVQAMGAQP